MQSSPMFRPKQAPLPAEKPRKFSIELTGAKRVAIKEIAAKHGISQREVILQMIDFAIEHSANGTNP